MILLLLPQPLYDSLDFVWDYPCEAVSCAPGVKSAISDCLVVTIISLATGIIHVMNSYTYAVHWRRRKEWAMRITDVGLSATLHHTVLLTSLHLKHIPWSHTFITTSPAHSNLRRSASQSPHYSHSPPYLSVPFRQSPPTIIHPSLDRSCSPCTQMASGSN